MKTYFLFGARAVHLKDYSSSTTELIAKIEEENELFDVFAHDPSIHSAKDLLDAMSGWGDYEEITEEEYLLLKAHLDSKIEVPELSADAPKLKAYRYSCTSNSIWASFDGGEVFAIDYHEAKAKANAELKEAFEKVNLALAHCDNTLGFTVEFDGENTVVEEIK
jgi:hypothetical protein